MSAELKLKVDFHPSEIPSKPGVYCFRDRFGTVIYVGKAINLKRRLSHYFQPGQLRRADPKLRSLIHSIHTWEYSVVRTEDEALILESRLIKDYAPHYNILMRDDKRYLLLRLNLAERFPTLTAVRVKKEDGARYFGPFPHGTALRETMEFLLAFFGLRACKTPEPDAETRKRCLKRIVKDCCAPCTGAVSEAEYRAKVDAMLTVLEGDVAPVVAAVESKMRQLAERQEFERAARCRDVIANLHAVFGRRNRNFANAPLPGSANGPEAVAALAKTLKLPHPIHTMICFDISNLLGKLAVASMVCFIDGRPARDEYRKFRIKTVFQSNDFAMMAEVVTRHFSRLLAEERPLPDLCVVDGGKGQLSAALTALTAIHCPAFPVIGLAEREEEIYIPGRSAPIVLDRRDPALRVVQALRDEAHRFAITFHRDLRLKRLTESLLDDIPGVGKVRKAALLKAFGSVKDLRRASPASIAAAVPGIGMELAEQILRALPPAPGGHEAPDPANDTRP